VKTGFFQKHGKMSGAIAICPDVPKSFKGLQYPPLFPSLGIPETGTREERETYNRHYAELLEKLDPVKVHADLLDIAGGAEPVLLCAERAKTWCHRRLVAEWLEMHLGMEITEVGLERLDVPPYAALWWAGCVEMLEELKQEVAALQWTFAKTMPQWPHWYIVRGPSIESAYVWLFQTTVAQGRQEYFFKRRQQYLYLGDGWKYWRMTNRLSQSRIINRCVETDSYV